MYQETSSLPQVEWIAGQPFQEVLHLANLNVAFEVSLEGKNLRITIIPDRLRREFTFTTPFNLTYSVDGLGVSSIVYNGMKAWSDSGDIQNVGSILNYQLPNFAAGKEYLNFYIYFGLVPVFYVRLLPIKEQGESRQVIDRLSIGLARTTYETLIVKPEKFVNLNLPDGRVIELKSSSYLGSVSQLLYRQLDLSIVNPSDQDNLLKMYYGNPEREDVLYSWRQMPLPSIINPFGEAVYCICVPYLQGDLQTGLMWIEISHNEDDAVLRILRVNV